MHMVQCASITCQTHQLNCTSAFFSNGFFEKAVCHAHSKLFSTNEFWKNPVHHARKLHSVLPNVKILTPNMQPQFASRICFWQDVVLQDIFVLYLVLVSHKTTFCATLKRTMPRWPEKRCIDIIHFLVRG